MKQLEDFIQEKRMRKVETKPKKSLVDRYVAVGGKPGSKLESPRLHGFSISRVPPPRKPTSASPARSVSPKNGKPRFNTGVGVSKISEFRLAGSSPASKQQSVSPSNSVQDESEAAERALSVHTMQDEPPKLSELMQINQLLDTADGQLKLVFGLFTQEKTGMLFAQIEKLVNAVFFRIRPLTLINGVGLVCVKLLLGYSEYYKCIWCLRKLIQLNEQDIAASEQRKKEIRKFHALRASIMDRVDSKSKSAVSLKEKRELEAPVRSNPLLRILLHFYRECGECHRFTHQQTEALQFFYKYLFLALYLGEHVEEANSYELLGRSYFELGDASRARYFNERVMHSIREKEDSISRRVFPEMRYRYNLSLMDINDSASKLRSESPTLEYYEGIPLSHQTILNDLLDNNGKGQIKEPLDSKRLHPVSKERRLMLKAIEAKAAREKLGQLTLHTQDEQINLQPGFGQFIASRLKLRSNSLDQMIMTHKSPNRSATTHGDVPQLKGKNCFKSEQLEVLFKEELITPLIDEFNSCGLLIQKLKKDASICVKRLMGLLNARAPQKKPAAGSASHGLT
jgi:hypothetical protein